MQRQKKEQGEQTRQTIIEVTTRLFATRGYAGTSLDLVAKESGTSKSSIFWHFANKEDLLFTVVDRAMSEWEVRAGTEILAAPDPPRQLRALVAGYRDLARTRPDTLRLLLGLLLETNAENPELQARFRRMYQGYRASVRMILDEGLASGHFAPVVPAERLAALVLACFDGLFVQRLLEPEAVPEAVFDDLERAVFALVMPGAPIPAAC